MEALGFTKKMAGHENDPIMEKIILNRQAARTSVHYVVTYFRAMLVKSACLGLMVVAHQWEHGYWITSLGGQDNGGRLYIVYRRIVDRLLLEMQLFYLFHVY